MATYEILLRNGTFVTLDFDDAADWETVTALSETGDGLKVLTGNRKFVPLSLFLDSIRSEAESAAFTAVAGVIEGLPDAIGYNPRGTYNPLVTYSEYDLVDFGLPDGRVGSFSVKVANTTQPPTNAEDWQVMSLPPVNSGGGAATGFTRVKLSEITGSTYLIDLAREGRYIIVRDAPKTVGFVNLDSLGYAIVAFEAPASGTIQAVTFTEGSNIEWLDKSPTYTTSAGFGDAFLLRTWNGSTIRGRQSESNIPFSTPSIQFLAGTKLLRHFKADSTRLLNLVAPASTPNQDVIATNQGTNRTPMGIDFVQIQGAFPAANLVNFNWNGAWTYGVVVSAAYANAPATGAHAFLGIAHETNTNKYMNALVQRETTAPNAPYVTLRARDSDQTPNVNGLVGEDLTAASKSGGVFLDNSPLHFFMIQHDGASQFNIFNVNTGSGLVERASGAPVANGYVNVNNTLLVNYSTGLRPTLGMLQRGNGPLGSSNTGVRYEFAIGQVLSAENRKVYYNYARDEIARTDPTGPQLPAISY